MHSEQTSVRIRTACKCIHTILVPLTITISYLAGNYYDVGGDGTARPLHLNLASECSLLFRLPIVCQLTFVCHVSLALQIKYSMSENY